jgi:hypothetical protein
MAVCGKTFKKAKGGTVTLPTGATINISRIRWIQRAPIMNTTAPGDNGISDFEEGNVVYQGVFSGVMTGACFGDANVQGSASIPMGASGQTFSGTCILYNITADADWTTGLPIAVTGQIIFKCDTVVGAPA